ncbi:MAG: sigma-70 family RNA polymerase sigma factor [Deltaproteobacteria bacterium]|nr:sigma-70 family RNA polymerase sigma factor [Deltaproteobacteria bacterium]
MDSEESIVKAAAQGETKAFELLVKKYQRYVYFLSMRMVGSETLADDITQRAFMKAYRALSKFEFRSSFKTWLSVITLNLCRTELAKKKRIQVEVPEGLSDDSEEKQEAYEDLAHQRYYLKQALEHLPARQKEVVILRIYQEKTFKDIASMLESSESAVKVNFHYAMKSLREWVKKRDLSHE